MEMDYRIPLSLSPFPLLLSLFFLHLLTFKRQSTWKIHSLQPHSLDSIRSITDSMRSLLLPPLELPLCLNPSAPPPLLPTSLLPWHFNRCFDPSVGPLTPSSPSKSHSPILSSPNSESPSHSPNFFRRPPRSRSLSNARLTPRLKLFSLSSIPSPVPVPASPPSSPYNNNSIPSPRAKTIPPSLSALASNAQPTLADDSTKLVKVIASHGKTGDQLELAYSHSKVVGNGSFGVVFSAKLAPASLGPDNEGDDDVAIKKVLQDKRFKVSLPLLRP